MTNYFNSRWYNSTKTIGTTQLDVTIGMLFCLFWFVVLTVVDIIETSEDDKWFQRLVIPTFVVILSFRIWASKQLIKATQVGPTANAAYKLCQYWQIISIAYVSIVALVTILGSYSSYDSMTTVKSCGAVAFIAFTAFGEGICLFRVNNFMQDLQSIAAIDAATDLLPSFEIIRPIHEKCT